jgi:SpoVK/Ycf46/Vps4 family AAA+-type ATPase
MGRFGYSDPIQRDLQSIIPFARKSYAHPLSGLKVPTGLLLVGPPGTGKTLIARLIASQTNRSSYLLTAASVLGRVGDSVKLVAAVFARGKEQSPSLVLIDEMDGLLPAKPLPRAARCSGGGIVPYGDQQSASG